MSGNFLVSLEVRGLCDVVGGRGRGQKVREGVARHALMLVDTPLFPVEPYREKFQKNGVKV